MMDCKKALQDANGDMSKAIVMKSFIDEAKGDSTWYTNPAVVKSCFAQAPSISTYLEQIYDQVTPKQDGGKL